VNDLDYFGDPGLITESPGTLNTDYYGLDTATAVYKCPMNSFGLIPAMLSAHPVWTWLYMEKRRVDITPGFLVITGDYAGITGGRTPSVFEMAYAGAEEPIETHVDFVRTLAGRPSAPLNGAIFLDPKTQEVSTADNVGVFEKFRSHIGTDRNPFSGIQAYLSPEATVREIWMATTAVNPGATLGKISNPPISVEVPSNWLYTGASFQQRGKVFQNTKEWRAAGRNGDSQIEHARLDRRP
jgi:hypothetical protein